MAARMPRVRRGAHITEADSTHGLLGERAVARGEQHWYAGVCYDTFNNRPRALTLNLACTWCAPPRRRDSKPATAEEPWYLATSLPTFAQAVAWYRQRMCLEETFKDFQSGFGLDDARLSRAGRLGRLVANLTLAVAGLHLLALPEARVLPRGWATCVVT
jgi:hypothetical protein